MQYLHPPKSIIEVNLRRTNQDRSKKVPRSLLTVTYHLAPARSFFLPGEFGQKYHCWAHIDDKQLIVMDTTIASEIL